MQQAQSFIIQQHFPCCHGDCATSVVSLTPQARGWYGRYGGAAPAAPPCCRELERRLEILTAALEVVKDRLEGEVCTKKSLTLNSVSVSNDPSLGAVDNVFVDCVI